LAPLTEATPKGLVVLAGEPLLWHTLRALRNAGATHVVVVCGHHGERLRAALASCPDRPPLDFVTNPSYRTTNSMFSLWLTRPWWERPFCVVDGDLLVTSRLLRRVFGAGGDAIAVDSGRRYADMEVKVEVVGGLASRLGNDLAAEHTDGEFFGVSRWTPEGARELAAAISRRLGRGGQAQRYAEAIGDVVAHRPVSAVPAERSDWAEIDRPGDLPTAERLVCQWGSSP
jgi:choline kinase